MANRTTIAVLTGLVVGALMGAGAVQYATLTADMLVARTYDSYRNQRYNDQQGSPAELRNNGIAGVRSTPSQTTQMRGAAASVEPPSRSSCVRISDGSARATCFENLINAITNANK